MIKTLDIFSTLKNLSDKLENYKMLYYTRFGDGDLNIMNGEVNNNRACITSNYNADLGQELRESFLIDHPQYMKALGANYPEEPNMKIGLFSPHRENDEIIGWLNNNLGITDGTYESHIMFHYIASFHPELYREFVKKYVLDKRKMFVGYLPKNQMELLFGEIVHHIEVPFKNSYFTIDDYYSEILDKVSDVELIVMNAGRSSAVLNKRLFNSNIEVQSIDFGSITEAAVGKTTRTWMRMLRQKGIDIGKNTRVYSPSK